MTKPLTLRAWLKVHPQARQAKSWGPDGFVQIQYLPAQGNACVPSDVYRVFCGGVSVAGWGDLAGAEAHFTMIVTALQGPYLSGRTWLDAAGLVRGLIGGAR